MDRAASRSRSARTSSSGSTPTRSTPATPAAAVATRTPWQWHGPIRVWAVPRLSKFVTMTNFATELSAAAAEAGDRPAVKLDDLVLTYSMLDAAVARAAGMLRAKGVESGQGVAMQLPNVPYFPIVYFGALRLGAVVVPMNPLLKSREVAYHLSDSGAKVMVAWHLFAQAAEAGSREAGAECVVAKPGEFESLLGAAEAVEDVVDRDDDDAAVIIYTSGTTGTPKGATLVHRNLAAGADTARDLVDATPDF